jgi:hypothetical protein
MTGDALLDAALRAFVAGVLAVLATLAIVLVLGGLTRP